MVYFAYILLVGYLAVLKHMILVHRHTDVGNIVSGGYITDLFTCSHVHPVRGEGTELNFVRSGAGSGFDH